MMQVTIHAAHITLDGKGTPRWALMLQKVIHTIEQFEDKGWHMQVVNQDNIAATITFHRPDAVDAESP